MSEQASKERALNVLAKARTNAKQLQPYDASGIYGLIPVCMSAQEVASMEAMGYRATMGVTPGMVLYYNPEWLIEQGPGKIGGVLLHEVQHVKRKHLQRSTGMDHQLSNIAGDLCINTDLERSGKVPLPKDGMFLRKYPGFSPGLTMEGYYRLLQKLQQQPEGAGGDGDPEPGDDEPGPGNGKSKSGGVTGGQCGGVAGNAPRGQLESQLDAKYGRTPIAIERIRAQVAHAITKHIATKGRGTVSGFDAEWAEAILGPTLIPWGTKLQTWLRSSLGRIVSGGNDYSMRRPSRRSYSSPMGVIRPGLIKHEPEILIVLDTSGSMSTAMLSRSLTEIMGILRALGISSVAWMEVDSDVCTSKRVSLKDLRKIQLHGRGGTNFCPAFYAAERLKPKPQLLIYVTDADGRAPESQPKGINCVWAIIGNTRPPAEWGFSVNIVETSVAKGGK
ncbi:MAG: VWA-like domain-containing protein [Dehalococcoidia bacterium]|nr:VWA-like domain-containing protein [Dehalococcoidia bacterium]